MMAVNTPTLARPISRNEMAIIPGLVLNRLAVRFQKNVNPHNKRHQMIRSAKEGSHSDVAYSCGLKSSDCAQIIFELSFSNRYLTNMKTSRLPAIQYRENLLANSLKMDETVSRKVNNDAK